MEALRTSDGPAWIKSSRWDDLSKVDAVLFDCDGVLVDARKSYDATILKVVDRLVRRWFDVRLPWEAVGPQLVLQIRRTGLFNNDWDTTYALTLFTSLGLAKNGVQIGEGDSRNRRQRRSTTEMTGILPNVRASVERFCSSVQDETSAYEAISSFLQSNTPTTGQARSVLVTVQEQLGYPGSPPSSLLATLFDEIYHGSPLYRRMYGVSARYNRGEGLIENEQRLIRKTDLDKLSRLLGKQRLAIGTGRPYLAAEYVLRALLSYFNLEASFFTGDADAPPGLRQRVSPFRKPSGQLLVHTCQTFSSDMLLYVGDSAEDVRMAETATLSGMPILSAGVYGSSSHPMAQAQFFRDQDVDVILPTARQVSTILRFARNEKRAD